MNKDLQERLELLGGVEAVYDQLNDNILFNLRSKNIDQLKKELQGDPPEVLQHVYDIALQADQYEICEAVQQIQRAVNINYFSAT